MAKKCTNCYAMKMLNKTRNLVSSDIEGLYGAMAIVLVRDRRWKPETVMALIKAIQEEWNDVAADSSENMMQKCKRITGIDIEQTEKTG